MNDSPSALLLVMWDLIAIAFFACGICILRTTARKLLQWDRRTGYGIYKVWPKPDGNDENAVEAAGCFYRIFGTAFVVMAGVHIIVVSGVLIWKLFSN